MRRKSGRIEGGRGEGGLRERGRGKKREREISVTDEREGAKTKEEKANEKQRIIMETTRKTMRRNKGRKRKRKTMIGEENK